MTTLLLTDKIILGIIIFLFGIVIGSFLNVCIYRIPAGESLSKKRSHCMSCGYQLRWFDLIPLFSYLFLGGKCRKCKAHISAQYPIIESLNGALYVLIFIINGWSIDSVIYCLLTSALIVLSVIDFRTYEIPFGINLFILALGLIHLGFHLGDWVTYVYIFGNNFPCFGRQSDRLWRRQTDACCRFVDRLEAIDSGFDPWMYLRICHTYDSYEGVRRGTRTGNGTLSGNGYLYIRAVGRTVYQLVF